jgi:hypothetical protein
VDGDNRKSIVGSPHMVFAVAHLLPVRLLVRLRRLMRHDQLLLAFLAVLVGGLTGGGTIVIRTTIALFHLLAYGSGDVRLLDNQGEVA